MPFLGISKTKKPPKDKKKNSVTGSDFQSDNSLTPGSSRNSSLSPEENFLNYPIGSAEWYRGTEVEFKEKWNSPSTNQRFQSNLSEFTLIKKLASGCFGPIVLVQHKPTKEYLALKVLDKQTILQKNQIEKAITEKKILQCNNFPFLVKIHSYSQDSVNLYMFMEYLSGGDLWSFLQRQRNADKKILNEAHVKFYISQIVLALEYLHNLGFIYRDLKPENIFMDFKGYLKLGDFGYSKYVGMDKRAYTFCGTKDYIAPEILLVKPYSKGVDFWALGVLIYELVCGITPFYSQDDNSLVTYERAISGKYSPPKKSSKPLKNLIHGLLQVDVTKRLGNLKNGIQDIKNHEFFNTVNWFDIIYKRVHAPYIPKISHDGDTKYFHTEYSDKGVSNPLAKLIARQKIELTNSDTEDKLAKYFQGF